MIRPDAKVGKVYLYPKPVDRVGSSEYRLAERADLPDAGGACGALTTKELEPRF